MTFPSDDESPPRERPTTPCPADTGAHSALLEELEKALAVARRSMARVRIDLDEPARPFNRKSQR